MKIFTQVILTIVVATVVVWTTMEHAPIVSTAAQNTENQSEITIQEIDEMIRQGTDDNKIIESIENRGLSRHILTMDDLVVLTQENTSEKVRQHVLKLLLDDVHLSRELRNRYFPIAEGLFWEYRVIAMHDVLIPYVYPIVRTRAYFDNVSEIMHYYVEDAEPLETGEESYTLVIENNLFDMYPWVFDEKGVDERSAISALLQFHEYESTYTWKVAEIERQSIDGVSYDIRVTEAIKVSFRQMGGGIQRIATMEHEVFQIPIIPSLERTIVDQSSRFATTYQLHTDLVETPLGDFENCIHKQEVVTYDGSDWIIHSIFAPDIGLIQQYQENPHGERTYLMELVRYGTPTQTIASDEIPMESHEPPKKAFREFIEALQEGNVEKVHSLCHPEVLEDQWEAFVEDFVEVTESLTEEIESIEILNVIIVDDMAKIRCKVRHKNGKLDEGVMPLRKYQDQWLIYDLHL